MSERSPVYNNILYITNCSEFSCTHTKHTHTHIHTSTHTEMENGEGKKGRKQTTKIILCKTTKVTEFISPAGVLSLELEKIKGSLDSQPVSILPLSPVNLDKDPLQ